MKNKKSKMQKQKKDVSKETKVVPKILTNLTSDPYSKSIINGCHIPLYQPDPDSDICNQMTEEERELFPVFYSLAIYQYQAYECLMIGSGHSTDGYDDILRFAVNYFLSLRNGEKTLKGYLNEIVKTAQGYNKKLLDFNRISLN